LPFSFVPQVDVDSSGAPHLFYTSNLSRFVGHYVTRSETGNWAIEDVDTARGSNDFFLDFEGTPTVLASDFIGNVSLWRRHGDWQRVEDVTGVLNIGGFGETQGDAAGCIHSVARFYDESLAYARRNGTWGFAPISTPATTAHANTRMALSPAGQPHVAFSEAGSGGWTLRWTAPPHTAESVPVEGFDGSAGLGGALAVAAGRGADGIDGMPHRLVSVLRGGVTGLG
jgi:hypothetical protein